MLTLQRDRLEDQIFERLKLSLAAVFSEKGLHEWLQVPGNLVYTVDGYSCVIEAPGAMTVRRDMKRDTGFCRWPHVSIISHPSTPLRLWLMAENI